MSRDNRLFHRYPASVKVAFRVRGVSQRGALANVSAGGGFVRSKALPDVGTRVQMAAIAESGGQSIWLDLRVCWRNEKPSEASPDIGFGGYWLHACSRESEEHLRGFLASVLGITKPIVRPVSPPAGGPVVYMYRFPEIYDAVSDDDFPWIEGRSPFRSPTDGRITLDPGLVGSDPPSLRDMTPDDATGEELGIDALAADGPGAPAEDAANGGTGRWNFLMQKLSGTRLRSKKESGSTPITPVTVTRAGEDVQYRVGRKSHAGKVTRLGTGWLVFETATDAPPLWSRIVVVVPIEGGRKTRDIEIHAQVTRLKQAEGRPTQVNCKIIRLDEKGMTGAYAQYVDVFSKRTT